MRVNKSLLVQTPNKLNRSNTQGAEDTPLFQVWSPKSANHTSSPPWELPIKTPNRLQSQTGPAGALAGKALLDSQVLRAPPYDKFLRQLRVRLTPRRGSGAHLEIPKSKYLIATCSPSTHQTT